MSLSTTSATIDRRLVSFLLFLTVFFLPLHFHPIAATAHVAKECSCIQGKRTEMGMAQAEADSTPLIHQILYESFELQFFSGLVSTLQLIRAPPTL